MAVSIFRKAAVLLLASFLVINFVFLSPIMTVKAATILQLRWSRSIGATTAIGPLAADLFGDGKMEIVVDGGSPEKVWALNATDGSTLWTYNTNVIPISVPNHNPFEIVDLNNDGKKEVVVAEEGSTIALFGNGSLYWNVNAPSSGNWLAAADIDHDGYLEVFVNSGYAPVQGYDWITVLSHDGKILRQAWTWHPCWGGVTIGDPNFDGEYILFQGDRSASYSADGDNYTGGGMGVRALDPYTLLPLWNDPTVLVSSQSPTLADLNGDGILEVIISDQSGTGIVIYNSTDGTALNRGGANLPAHSQPTVYDIDGDGHDEIITCRQSNPKIWDLTTWNLKATLPIVAEEPPKIGDVTGDGKLDIVAPSYTWPGQIYVYSYNNVTKNYDQVYDYGTNGELPGPVRSFTLIQDINGDGKNELVCTSSGGTVYCFNTPGLAPSPLPRSNLQFYSEQRDGASVYVPPPVAVRPALTNEQPIDKSMEQTVNPTLSVNATDYAGGLMDITFSTNASGTWENIQPYTNKANGTYTALPSNMNGHGTTYYWSVTATDRGTGKSSSTLYSFTTYSNPPTQSQPSIVSSGGTNGKKENLTCSNSITSDPEGDSVTNIYNWYVNGLPLANLVLPLDTRPDLSPNALLTDGFESNFNNWNGNGVTNWDRNTAQKHSGQYSAHATLGDTYLTSDDIDTSTAEDIIVSFWYRNAGNAYLQFWNGTAYNNIFGLANTGSQWRNYVVEWRTFLQYGIQNFRIRFDATRLGSGQNLYLDDVSVTVVGPGTKDYSGYNNNGKVTGATWTSAGQVGGAYSFDGTDSIRVNENGSSLGGDGSWSQISIEFWIKATTTTSTRKLIWKTDPIHNSSSYEIDFRPRGTSNEVTWKVNTPISSYSAFYSIADSPSSWHHIVCTYKSGTGLQIYVDGTQRATTFAVGNINPTVGGPLYIGYQSGVNDFAGMLDEVRIYPRALSPMQVSARHQDTANGLSTNSTIAWQETQVGDVWKCQVTPNDGFGDGQSMFSNTLTVVSSTDNPPTAQNLTLTPSQPHKTDTLAASYTYSDPDSDPEWGTEIRWYQNNALQPLLNDSLTVPSSFLTKGQIWRFTVRPKDGVMFGNLQNSSSVTILNSPPTFTSVYITPEPALNTSTLTANPVGWSDADNDTQGYRYQWQILNAGTWQNITGQVSSTLSPGNFKRGDIVQINCTAWDGQDMGASQVDAAWIVDSNAPTQGTPLLVSGPNGIVSYNQTTYAPSGNAVTNMYHWIDNGISYENLLLSFDTNTSHTVKDYSGYGNDGTVSGATWTSQGRVGGAFNFDGTDVITIPDSPSLMVNNTWSQMSIEFWIMLSSPKNGTRIIAKVPAGSSSGSYMVGLQSSGSPSNTLFFGVSTAAGYTDIHNDTYTTLNLGSWYHVVCTYKSGPGLTIYINGVQQANAPLTGNITRGAGNEPLFLGYDGGGSSSHYLNGTLDEVMIYPTALTPQQVMQRYTETKDGLSSNSTIVTQEVKNGQWQCEVTPSDSWQDGTAKVGIVNNSTLTPTNVTFSMSPNPAVYHQTVTLSGTLTDINSNPIYPATLTREYSTNGGATWINWGTLSTNSTGGFSITFTPYLGNYVMRVNYTGSATYNPSTQTQPLVVQSNTTINTQVVFTLSPNQTVYPANVALSGRLTDINNTPIYPASLTMENSTDNGVSWVSMTGVSTNSSGYFTATIISPNVGTYLFRVSYSGNSTYNSSTQTQSLIVKSTLTPTNVTFSMSPNPVVRNQYVNITGRLTDNNNNPIYPATLTCDYSADNGITWSSWGTLSTNSTGYFTRTSLVTAYYGTYLIRVSYAGNSAYNPSSQTVSLAVVQSSP